MKVLIAMAVNNSPENKRFQYTKQTLQDLVLKTNFHRSNGHELTIVNNGNCEETMQFLQGFVYDRVGVHHENINLISNSENIGTARAINLAWKNRLPGQHCIKMDDDVIIHSSNWVEQMVEAIEREPRIGIVGLKRKDCTETPYNPNPDLLSELEMLPHETGQRWIIVERAKHIIGTCQMYNSALLDKIGYLYQPSLYGFDDVIASYRSHIALFWNVFLPHIEIEHIDDGQNEYQHWKEKHSSEVWDRVNREVGEMIEGKRPIYIDFY